MEKWVELLTPIILALIAIIPTIIANRRKTQESIETSNKKLYSEISGIKAQVTCIKKALDEHVGGFEERKAKQARYRILRFYDDLCEGHDRSESHFEDILDDIDFYETYCEKHSDFKNNRGAAAMEYIKAAYAEEKARCGFLKPKKGAQHERN